MNILYMLAYVQYLTSSVILYTYRVCKYRSERGSAGGGRGGEELRHTRSTSSPEYLSVCTAS